MRRAAWTAAIVCAAAGTAWAQARPPARPPASPPPASPAPPAGTAPTTTDASATDAGGSVPLPVMPRQDYSTVAPPPEVGWTTIQMDGGYLRWRVDQPEEPSAPSVSVMPGDERPESERVAGAVDLGDVPPGPAAREEEGVPGRPSKPAPPACSRERENLAKRLAQLRGLDVDPTTAQFILDAAGEPLSPHQQLALYGRVWLGTPELLLVEAVKWDTDSRLLATELAHCLERTRGGSGRASNR